MSKKYMYLFGAALLALSGVGASAQSVQAKSAHHARRTNVTRNYQRYFVNAPSSISSNAKKIYGTATAGSYVMLQNGNKTVSKTYANRNGRYVLSVPKSYRAGTNLRVVAKKGYWHPYKMVAVKTPANQRAAVSANKKTTRKSVKRSTKRAKTVRKAPKAVKHNGLANQIDRLQKQMNALVTRNTKESKEYNFDKTQLTKLESQYKAAQQSSIKRSARQSRVRAVKGKISQLNQEIATLEGQLKGSNRKVTKKAPAKRVNRKARVKVAPKRARKTSKKTAKLAQSPTGNWTARQSRTYTQNWSFSQARGLNETLYHNGRYAKKLVNNASYKLDSVKPNFWKITYKPDKSNKTNTMYMHLLSGNRFQVTNAKGQRAGLSFVRA